MSERLRIGFRGALGAFRLDVAFSAGAGVTALFGPSGCGKTTVLRCIAGLQRLAGECTVNGQVWQDGRTFLPPHRRKLGYVFQEPSLFPHLSVLANLRYGVPRGARRLPGGVGLEEAAALLGLEPLLDRAPRHLSGGERQRVAIGRAILSRPELLLMDEPLAALDRAAREEILPFVERLHASLALPILYVSHDMGEVERLADRLVLLDGGRVIAAGKLADLQSDIALPLATRRDAAVSLDGVVQGFEPGYGMLAVSVAGSVFSVPSEPVPRGERRRLRIAARDVSLARSPAESTISNVLPAHLEAAAAAGPFETLVTLRLEAGPLLLARLTRQSWDRLGLALGQRVYAQVKAVALTR